MAECSGCRAEIASFDRRCWQCGAGIKRDVGKLFAGAPTDKELSQARLCHLLALPGMLVLGLFIETAVDRVGLLAFVPLNLVIPFVFWLSTLKSRFVRNHGLQTLNFQLLWTVVMFLVWYWFNILAVGVLNDLVWLLAYVVVLMGGIALVWIASNDAASAGDGKYPIRIPID
ncbi:MAG: DUF4870 domain-containing protein [Dehalococcoidia bacterium]|nr:DUF4870 domain-containing protein [Dehalococcoidia bacterium]